MKYTPAELIFSSKIDFTEKALSLFRFQYEHNTIYKRYVDAINCTVNKVDSVEKIPFLPISFFKTEEVTTTRFTPDVVFESSGTTGSVNSRHLVKEKEIYEQSFRAAFEKFYGAPNEYCVIGLLPSYLERGNSSLVYMVDKLIQLSHHPLSGFYLYDFPALKDTLQKLQAEKHRTILIGVTYALLDFAQDFPMPLTNTIIMETGGMKGRRRELLRLEVHDLLKQAFRLESIHSEYGMTELLSQAYALQEGRFQTPDWMKVLLREEDDPFRLIVETGKTATGAVNIIDLANIYSCSFIATDDIGRLHPDGTFEILGRMDNSDIRGCSLLAV